MSLLSRKKFTKKRFGDPVLLSEALTQWLPVRAKSPKQEYLHQMWLNWDMVLGNDLYQRAMPLGVRGKTLCIGAEDNMELMEIRMDYDTILARVNAFMGEEYFNRLEFSLYQGKTPLTQPHILPERPPRYEPPLPKRYGTLNLDADDIVGKCYRAYLENIKRSLCQSSN